MQGAAVGQLLCFPPVEAMMRSAGSGTAGAGLVPKQDYHHQGSPQNYTVYHLLNSEFVQILGVVQNTLVLSVALTLTDSE